MLHFCLYITTNVERKQNSAAPTLANSPPAAGTREARSGVEDELGDLAALHARAVGAVGGTLELHGDLAALHLRHALLPEVAELVAVQDDAGRVEGVRLDLHRVLEPHGERAARAVREVLAEVLPQDHALPLELDLGAVLGRAAAGAVQPEARDEDPLVHGELDAVAAAPVAPLVAPVGAGLEAVAALRHQPLAGLAHELQLGLLGRRVPEEDVVGLVQSQDAGLRSTVGEIVQGHGRDADQVERLAQHLALVLNAQSQILSLAFHLSPVESGLEDHNFFGIQSFPAEDAFQGLEVDVAEPLGLERQLGLGVDHLPAALGEVRLLEQAALGQEHTGVLGAQAGLQEIDAGPGEVRDDVLFGSIKSGQDCVSSQVNFITIDVSARKSPACKWNFHQMSVSSKKRCNYFQVSSKKIILCDSYYKND